MATQSDQLCEHCSKENLAPDFIHGLDLAEIGGGSSRNYVRSYTTLVSRVQESSAQGCPWCFTILESLFDQPEDAIEGTVIVSKEYRSSGYPQKTTISHAFVTSRVFKLDSLEERITSSVLCFTLRDASRLDGHQAAHQVAAVPHDERLRGDSSTAKLAVDMSQAREWIRECLDSHTNCNRDAIGLLPSRVIDVRPDQDENNCRLHISTPGETAKYSALSYCWGGEQATKLTIANVAQYKQSLQLNALPKTIQDAIIITRSLALTYLWVDSICILQDSKEDKKKEIRQMRRIFKDAHVTIVASTAATAYQGFLPPRVESDTRVFYVTSSGSADKSRRVVQFNLLKDLYHPLTEPVNKRAWTLEERLLSRRLLIFSGQGLLWQCQQQETFADDDVGPNPFVKAGRERILSGEIASLQGSAGSFNDKVPRLWLDIVQDYCDRELTHPEDKLTAIAGIAEEFSRNWGSHLGPYRAGFWTNFLVQQLHWELLSDAARTRPPVNRGPSWSWIAVDGSVVFRPPQSNEETQFAFEVMDCQLNLHDKTVLYGSMSSGHLTIKAATAQALWKPSIRGAAPGTSNLFLESSDGAEDVPIGRATADTVEVLRNGGPIKVTLALLVIWDPSPETPQSTFEGSIGIVLVPAGHNTYRRLASFRGLPTDDLLDASELQEIKLV